MSNNPFITLCILGKDVTQLKGLIREDINGCQLSLSQFYPVPCQEDLRNILFSNRRHINIDDIENDVLESAWKKEYWGVTDETFLVNEYFVADGLLYVLFRVKNSAPIEWMSYMVLKFPQLLFYLGYNDLHNPEKYSFIGQNGSVWPLKAEGMLTDYNGRAVFKDKFGDYRYSHDNIKVPDNEVNFHAAQNHCNFLIYHVINSVHGAFQSDQGRSFGYK